MKLFFIAAVFLAVCASALAGCPTPATVDTIDVRAYTGLWYEIANSKGARETFEHDLVCETANYTLRADGSVLVVNEGRAHSVNGTLAQAVGQARQVSGGKFQVKFGGPFWAPYWVIQLYGEAAAGYDVALVYSCVDFVIEGQALWILSRTPELPAPYTIDDLLLQASKDGLDVPQFQMKPVQQDGCPL